MTSSPQMIQVYQDEEGSVGEHAPFLPHHQRWAKHSSSKRSHFRRLALAGGAFLTLYLLFCTWAAHARNETFDSFGDLPGAEFPHRKLPWPFPRRPHDPPRHHFKPTVLGCTAVPTPSEDSSLKSVELKVTIPKHHLLVLEDHLIWGDVSVSKVAPDSDMTALSEKNLTVGITVAKRKCPHHPPESVVPLDDDSEEEEKKFVLCALSFTPGHHKGKPHPDELSEKPDHPHPHPHPPHFPHPPPHVTVAVLPAHNETYPRFPGPHHPPPPPPGAPPHRGPGEGDEEDVEMTAQPASVFSRAWRSTLSFLFPMLPVLSDSFPHHPPHGHPPPPPPFIVTSLTVEVPKFVPVKYGLPFRHFRRHFHH